MDYNHSKNSGSLDYFIYSGGWFKKFILLMILVEIVAIAGDYLLIDDTIIFNSLSDSLSYDRIIQTIDLRKQYSWIGYIALPIIFIVKIFLIYITLRLGLYLQENSSIRVNRLLLIVVLAEFVFMAPALIKIIWFSIYKTDYSLDDLQSFYPFSVINFFEFKNLSRYLIYPLQVLNIFEIAYWFLLAHGMANVTGFSFWRSFGLVLSSYGVGLVLWVVLVMFLTITYS